MRLNLWSPQTSFISCKSQKVEIIEYNTRGLIFRLESPETLNVQNKYTKGSL